MVFLQFILFASLIGGIGMLISLLRRRFSGRPASTSGDPYEFSVTRGKSRRISQVRLAIEAPNTLSFILRRENVLDRCGKALGIAGEWETSDRSFDESLFILSDDRILCGALSADADLRAAVMELFSDGMANSVECANGRLWIVLRNVPREYDSRENADVAAALASTYRPALARLGEKLATLHAPAWDGERDPGEHRTRWLLIASAVLGAGGLAGFLLQMNVTGLPRQLLSDRIDVHTTTLAASVAAVAVTALFVLVGRTSRTHLVLLAMLLTIVPATWLGGRVYYTWRNETLDTESPTDYVARIEDAYTRSGKSRRYYLIVDRWPDERFERTLQVSAAVYAQFHPGDCVRFDLHRGYFGDPWLSAIEPAGGCGGSEPPG
jgi:hypothetical protein